uniref:F-box domain-containing protein n=1 Tax=Compsopogon caeruleus TaxID=31354 RepID=A0A7S1TGZ3_9RHOD|mmetsp:Transcript_3602/g.6836  ORF Transcript_3602/g.6836 Transcript_3602/m.6836 type:complete len:477 (+) Transcript_3602:184-1614(+)
MAWSTMERMEVVLRGGDEDKDVIVVDEEEERRLALIRERRVGEKRRREVEYFGNGLRDVRGGGGGSVEVDGAAVSGMKRVGWVRARKRAFRGEGRAGVELAIEACGHLDEPSSWGDGSGRATRGKVSTAAGKCDEGSYFGLLPDDLIVMVFAHLRNTPDLWKVSAVCRRWKKLAWYPVLWREVSFEDFEFVNDAVIARIISNTDGMPGLRKISLARCHQVTEISVRAIPRAAGASTLEEIDLSWCAGATDQSVAELSRCSRLKVLRVAHNRAVSRRSIRDVVCQCPSLEVIDLFSCRSNRLESHLLESLSIYCSELRELNVANGRNIQENSVIGVVTSCVKLERLDLSWCRHISYKTASVIASTLVNLTHLSLSETKVDDFAVFLIAWKCRNLVSLQLARCRSVSDDGLEHIAKHLSKTISYLNLGSCHRVSDDAVMKLIRVCTNLKCLDVSKLPCRKLSQCLEDLAYPRGMKVYY